MSIRAISRRSFVAGAAGAAVAGACAGARAAVAADDDPAADNVSPIAPLEVPAAWDVETDVLVVGAGGGLAGAAIAAENGARVVLIDKMPEIGGASKEASEWIIPGTKVHEEYGVADITDALLQWSLGSAPFGTISHDLIVHTMDASKRMVHWMRDLGFEWMPSSVSMIGGLNPESVVPVGTEEGGMTARAMMYAYQFLANKFAADGGDLRLSTALEGLVMDGGRVLGALVSGEEGAYYIRAEKGVLLTTGGFGANRDMLAKYTPTALTKCKYQTAGPQDTGEGIRMGLGAGAQFDGFDWYTEFDGGIDGVDWNTYMYISAVQIARQPWLGITRYGERYPYIPGGGGTEYAAAARLLDALPGHEGFVFFDAKYKEYGPTFKQGMCRRLIDADTMPDEGRVPEVFVNPHWYDGVAEAIDSGLIPSANTIEELAEKLGLDPAKVVAAVEEWNAICEAGHDPEEKMPDEFLNPIVEPPFCGMALGTFLIATHAGLVIDTESRVIDTKGNPIPGLFAAGNTVAWPMPCANGSCAQSAAAAFVAGEVMSAL